MTEHVAVSQFLTELRAGLPALGRLRSRVLIEVADHLNDDIETRMSAGLSMVAATQAALAAFGPADVVARDIAETVARGALRRVFTLGAALFVVVIACSSLVTSDFVHVSAWWLADGVGTLFIWIVAQVGLVAGGLSVIRALAHTLGRPGTAQLYIVRGMLVVAICAAMVLGVDAIGVLAGPGSLGFERVVAVVAVGGAGLAAVPAAVRASRRVEACLRALGISLAPDTTITEDVCSASARLSVAVQQRAPSAAPLVRAAGKCAARCQELALRRAPWLTDWTDTRRHPWRFAFLVLAPLAALSVIYGIVQSLIVGSPASVAGPVALAVFECALALTGYAALGPYLALRNSRAAPPLVTQASSESRQVR